MDTANGKFSISHAKFSAGAAIFVLCGVVAWTLYAKPALVVTTAPAQMPPVETPGSALAALASSTAPAPENITPLGASIFAQAVVAYDKATQIASSSDAGLAAVQDFGATVRPPVDYHTYASSDIKTDTDTSKDRVLSYRADLRVALEPLLENKEYELDIFAKYIDTKDTTYLNQLRIVAQNYRLAIANTEKVVAPADAASYQAEILTSLSKFAATLDALADNAKDPFATSALLRTFLDAQDGVVASLTPWANTQQGKYYDPALFKTHF